MFLLNQTYYLIIVLLFQISSFQALTSRIPNEQYIVDNHQTTNENTSAGLAHVGKIDISDDKNNEMIPMADDDGSITPHFALVYGGYLPLPIGLRCHSMPPNSSI